MSASVLLAQPGPRPSLMTSLLDGPLLPGLTVGGPHSASLLRSYGWGIESKWSADVSRRGS